ncbi:Glutamate-ammonia-ligase adenylyltransferase [Pelagimonas phthalicica]|uniref:Glutamate-ammonia-ligase adenylyltransferase n=1 Tax=Pelagimonas phthalicica TaxID=1037362 RepID=A0A238JC57_9RHOB|nr:glutamine-synthetase adenylyltransferase [Pelagimonas phthalicica]TDS91253.1 glutamate-ammonia-ligase adenylyltransferase [Pelagimonas phthalicica]SMX28301.1 Glutamate-ammonia-ligase adenylyltransferase [Pelagimonas phthalicica]
MNLSDRITRLPRPYDTDHADEAKSLAPWASGDVYKLLHGTCGSSPYLKGLLAKETDWLEGAIEQPEQAMSELFANLRQADPDAVDVTLRQAKRRVALLIALCDLSGVWTLEDVTGALTDFSDLAVQLALEAAIAKEVRRGKLPGQSEDDIATAGGMVCLAMGKGGAHELNYSSDIDLICLFDETRYERDDFHAARTSLVRATRKMASTLSDLTGEGYVFRTDLRLRPDPAVTPVCMAMEAAERYYESLGRTWERAAYIKARPAAGDIQAGERFLHTLKPFVWRKHLDFAAIQDAHDMRLRIREHKGLGGPITLPGHNMKLGRGGIREIEFFTQTRQLIAGGRDPELRTRQTVPGLQVLAAKGWIPQDAADVLAEHYRAHRDIEHRIQMVNDAQTHDLPKSPEGFERLAYLAGMSAGELEQDLTRRLTEVHDVTEGFFAPDAGANTSEFDEGEHAEISSRWLTYPSLRSERAVEIFKRLRPEILNRLGQAAKPEEALLAFDGFLKGLPAGVQLFSLFEANPQLIDLLIDVVSTSPDLAQYLSRNSKVFDAVIGGDFFSPWPGRSALTQELSTRLQEEPDYERRLDLARRWGKEWHFRVGVHLLRGLMEGEEAGRAYADLAEATLAATWPVVQEEFARKYGPCPGRGAVVVGMGSLGTGRLHAHSDLDVIVIYDPDGVEFSDGKRSLASRTYYARLTQALITAMTAPMAEGRLYEVDMRLRPSGNQGPVATSWESFQNYQREEAWTWEHLALTRARVVAGPADLAADVEAFRLEVLRVARDREAILQDVGEMRVRIAAAKGEGNLWGAKIGAGRMQDIELFSQAATLVSGQGIRHTPRALRVTEWLNETDRQWLIDSYALFWSLQIGSKLISPEALDPETLGSGGCAFLTRLTNTSDMESLKSELTARSRHAAEIITAEIPLRAENEEDAKP